MRRNVTELSRTYELILLHLSSNPFGLRRVFYGMLSLSISCLDWIFGHPKQLINSFYSE